MKWLMAIPVWSTPRDSLNRFNLVFSRCPYEESPLGRSFFAYFARRRVVPKYHAPRPSLTAPMTFSAIWYGCCRP